MANPAGLEKTLAAADEMLGLDLVRVIHSNDSKGALGSHLDRHENIGKGKIGEAGFRRILTHPALRRKRLFSKLRWMKKATTGRMWLL